jgi:hypothetical protein
LERGRIRARKDHLESVVRRLDPIQDGPQWHAGKPGIADGLLVPLVAFAGRVEAAAAIASTFEPDLVGLPRKLLLQRRQVERQRLPNSAVDLQAPVSRPHLGRGVIRAQKEERIWDERARHLAERGAEIQPIAK